MGGEGIVAGDIFLARLDCVRTMEGGLLTSKEGEIFALELAVVSGTWNINM